MVFKKMIAYYSLAWFKLISQATTRMKHGQALKKASEILSKRRPTKGADSRTML